MCDELEEEKSCLSDKRRQGQRWLSLKQRKRLETEGDEAKDRGGGCWRRRKSLLETKVEEGGETKIFKSLEKGAATNRKKMKTLDREKVIF